MFDIEELVILQGLLVEQGERYKDEVLAAQKRGLSARMELVEKSLDLAVLLQKVNTLLVKKANT
jgi:hypothetical protein